MALTTAYLSSFGTNFPACYLRITKIELTDKTQLRAELSYYADQTCVKSSQPVFINFKINCLYDLDGPNPIKQAYLHLKTLPEFADAIDC